MRSMTCSVAAAVLLLLLAGNLTPALADRCYFVNWYGPPQGPFSPFLEAEVIEVSGEPAFAAPDGYTSVTLDSLHGLGLLSPGEASAASEDSGWAGPEEGTPDWHYYCYFLTKWDRVGHWKHITCGSKVW
jgi:hypothetical protein